jgi:hypothetical protein
VNVHAIPSPVSFFDPQNPRVSPVFLFRPPFSRSLLFRSLLFRSLLFRSLLFRSLLFRSLLFRSLLFRSLSFRSPLLRSYLFRFCLRPYSSLSSLPFSSGSKSSSTPSTIISVFRIVLPSHCVCAVFFTWRLRSPLMMLPHPYRISSCLPEHLHRRIISFSAFVFSRFDSFLVCSFIGIILQLCGAAVSTNIKLSLFCSFHSLS